MGQKVVTKLSGLKTFKNELGQKDGAMILADNIVIDRDDVAESRRGFNLYGDTFGGSTDRSKQILQYKNRALIHYGTKLLYDNGSGTLAEFNGSYSELSSGLRIKGLESNGNFYFTTTSGIKKISATSASEFTTDAGYIKESGAPKALDVTGYADVRTAGFLSGLEVGGADTKSVVAYRILWGYKDSNTNLILGSPSSISVVRNLDAVNSSIVQLQFTIPDEVTATSGHFYQIYRSPVKYDGTGIVTPEDELQLVYEDFPTSAQISAGVVGRAEKTTLTFLSGASTTQADYLMFEEEDETNWAIWLDIDASGTAPTGAKYVASSNQLEVDILSTDTATQVCTKVYNAMVASGINNVSLTDNLDGTMIVLQDYIGDTTDPIPYNADDSGSGSISVTMDIQGIDGSTDITPNDFQSGGAYLYTNGISGDGILQSNDRPPLAKDVSLYKNSLFFGNTKTRHRFDLSLISTSLLSNGDQIIIGNAIPTTETYEFAATEDVENKKVLLATGGTVSQNIDDTARSLVKVINRNSGGLVYAFYLSSVDDVPGQILLESRSMSDISFYVKIDDIGHTDAFNPSLPIDNSETSLNEDTPNRIYYAKTSQPESVPIVNYIDVGAKDTEILRIIGLRDSLFILKSEGIFRLSGADTSSFVVTEFDTSSSLIAPDSAQVLNNQIYMLTTQGVVSLTDSGVTILSRDIEKQILEPTSSNYVNFSSVTFGISYESDRSYLLFLPSETDDSVATQCFRYNVFTRTWVRWDVSKTCGLVLKSDDKLYLGASDTNQIEQERKTFDRTDYADREYSLSITDSAVNGKVVGVSSMSNLKKYDVIHQTQWITIERFNRILNKLDRDQILDDTDYLSTQEMQAGDNLLTSMQNLITKIDADDTTAVYSIPSGSEDFVVLKTEFNTMTTELNASTGTFYTDYPEYTTSIEYESPIMDLSNPQITVTLLDILPLMKGDITCFKGIVSEGEWSPQHLGDVSIMKQIREGSLLIDQFNFTTLELSFRTDISDNLEMTEISGEGNGAFGSQIFGSQVFGGLGNQRPGRTYIPRNKQRCRFMIVRFGHRVAREKYAINGYSLVFNDHSNTTRAYRS